MRDDEFISMAKDAPTAHLSDATRQKHLAVLAGINSGSRPADPVARLHRPLRAGAIVLAGAVLLAGAGVGVAAAFGAFSKPTERGTAHCYATAAVDDKLSNYSTFMFATPTGVGDTAAVALEICQRDWNDGRFHAKPPYVTEPDPTGVDHPVPSLVVCVLEAGDVGVFPGDSDTCARLNLTIADLGPAPTTSSK